jgi:hypothetical protein
MYFIHVKLRLDCINPKLRVEDNPITIQMFEFSYSEAFYSNTESTYQEKKL